jgi:tetratricopeptide (TPR) repeat protein
MTGLKPDRNIELQQVRGLKRRLILMFFLMIMVPQLSMAENAAHHRLFFEGISHYQQGRYPEAIQAFKDIVHSGIQNGRLFYNLGNACLKNGDIGHAILYYERAGILIPNDPDLKFNLNYARTLVKDKPQAQPSSILSVLFSWKKFLGKPMIQWLALLLNLMFWACLTVRLIRREKSVKTISIVLLSTAGIFVGLAGYDYIYPELTAGRRDAVVLPPEISVRSGLSENSTELFVLHAGTRITVEREKNGYYRIYFAEEKIGWIPKEQAGLIQT